MTDYLQLIIGVCGLALVAFYVVWTQFRVFCIRQELFEVRNELWDKARALDGFDDPAYVDARSNLNSLIRWAHKVSLPVLVHMFANYSQERRVTPKSLNGTLQTAIERAEDKSVECLTRYVMYYRPFSGLLWAKTIMAIYKTSKSVGTIRDSISSWFRGGGPGQLEALSCH